MQSSLRISATSLGLQATSPKLVFGLLFAEVNIIVLSLFVEIIS